MKLKKFLIEIKIRYHRYMRASYMSKHIKNTYVNEKANSRYIEKYHHHSAKEHILDNY